MASPEKAPPTGHGTATGEPVAADGSGERRAVLSLVYGPDPGRIGQQVLIGSHALPLDRTAPVLGAAPLDDPDVSRRHAEVVGAGGACRIRDLGSRNGTFVRGRRLGSEPEELRPGDVVRLGGTLLLFHEARVPRGSDAAIDELLGLSDGMRAVRSAIDRYAPAAGTGPGAPVLVLGESGTGKELVSRALAARGRPGRPFLACSIAETAPTLVESTLFGHEKGAFTGATHAAPGLFRGAHGGTLFLDEIGEATPEVQTRLLRVIEAQTVRPLGSSAEVKVDVRLVTATNRPLAEDAAAGRFRLDLYARLAHLVIEVPPLRERLEDVPVLAAHLLARRAGAGARFSGRAMERLLLHTWPLNVRELVGIVDIAVADWPGSGPVTLSEGAERRLDEHARLFGPRPPARLDAAAVRDALSQARGNMAETARLLGKDRGQLYRIARGLGLDPADFR